MAHIDTLEMYEKYLEAGYTEKQAHTAVQSLDAAFDGVVTRNDLLMLEKDLKIFFSWEIAAFFIVMLFWPKASKRLGWG